MKPKRRTEGPGTIELVEEAVHLLRRAPAGLLALNAFGTLPFALAFLYFWAEMSRGAFAWEHAGRNALGVTLAFLWMKFWQTIFASELRARVAGQTPAPWTAKKCGQLALTQTALQPIGLFALPVAAVVVLPFGWAYCFFQNLTALRRGIGDDCRCVEVSGAASLVAAGAKFSRSQHPFTFWFFCLDQRGGVHGDASRFAKNVSRHGDGFYQSGELERAEHHLSGLLGRVDVRPDRSSDQSRLCTALLLRAIVANG